MGLEAQASQVDIKFMFLSSISIFSLMLRQILDSIVAVQIFWPPFCFDPTHQIWRVVSGMSFYLNMSIEILHSSGFFIDDFFIIFLLHVACTRRMSSYSWSEQLSPRAMFSRWRWLFAQDNSTTKSERCQSLLSIEYTVKARWELLKLYSMLKVYGDCFALFKYIWRFILIHTNPT